MKQALFFTYHLIRSYRYGGILDYINILLEKGFAIDMVTVPISLNWIFKNNDRENIINLIKLIIGIKKGNIRNWGFPRIVPYRLSRFIFKDHQIAGKFTNISFRLKNNYDIIFFESTVCIEYYEKIRAKYPKAKIIYRASDPIAMYSSDYHFIQKEKNIISKCNETWVVDIDTINYYKEKKFNISKCKIIPNFYFNEKDIKKIKNMIKKNYKKEYIIYFGVQTIDFNLINDVASHFNKDKIYIFGPYNQKSKKNILIYKSIPIKKIFEYLSKAKMMIIPYGKIGNKNKYINITRKMVIALLFGLPIVIINANNKLKLENVYIANDNNSFIEMMEIILNSNINYYENHLKSLEALKCYNYSYLYEIIENCIREIL